MSFLPAKEQLKILTQGCIDLVSEEDLLKKLQKSEKENRPLKVKAGFDPTSPDLHLGHTVVMNKMAQFQNLGHHVIFIIGDFTALIGDPTGKNETRPPLSESEIKKNAETYASQVFKILDSKKVEIVYNSQWLNGLGATGLIKLAAKYTLARMLERDDFQKRYSTHQTISLHELLYPLLQGYDSVAIQADIELGGTEQIFNLLVGRDLQKSFNIEPQCVLTMPLLVGLDGHQKMSKSLGNYIGVSDSPTEMFGKTMRLSDELMFHYYELLTHYNSESIAQFKADISQGIKHPKQIKIDLANLFVTRFYSKEIAQKAQTEFERIFSNKGLPDNIQIKEMSSSEIDICHLLVKLELVPSTSEARRLVTSHAIEIDGEKIEDPKWIFKSTLSKEHLIKVGKKKFLKVKIV